MSRYKFRPEDWTSARFEERGDHWTVSLLERELSSSQQERIRAAAFDQVRRDGFVPSELLDLVEGYREEVLVQLVGRVQDGTIGLAIRRIAPNTEAADAISASEALSFFLRIMLRELRLAETEGRAAPVRTMKLLPRSVIAEIAGDILASCEAWEKPPGPILNALIRDLLSLDHHPEATANADHQDDIAFVVAQLPNIGTRELSRRFNIDPGTISRWRRSSEFKKRVQRNASLIETLASMGEWPPKRLR